MTTRDSSRKAFDGTWEIMWTKVWRKDALDLDGPAFIRFEKQLGADQGEFKMIAVQGWLDCRYGERDGRPAVEFSWQGTDEGDERCGRGWAVLVSESELRGWLFFHCGDDSEFNARRSTGATESRRSRKGRSPKVRQ
jgi:hypothetical protein